VPPPIHLGSRTSQHIDSTRDGRFR
jgi:hypothetical protein